MVKTINQIRPAPFGEYTGIFGSHGAWLADVLVLHLCFNPGFYRRKWWVMHGFFRTINCRFCCLDAHLVDDDRWFHYPKLMRPVVIIQCGVSLIDQTLAVGFSKNNKVTLLILGFPKIVVPWCTPNHPKWLGYFIMLLPMWKPVVWGTHIIGNLDFQRSDTAYSVCIYIYMYNVIFMCFFLPQNLI